MEKFTFPQCRSNSMKFYKCEKAERMERRVG